MSNRVTSGPLFTTDQFRSLNFRVDEVVGRIAVDILTPQQQAPIAGAPPRSSSSTAGIPADTASNCQRLLEQFQRAERDLIKLQSAVNIKAAAAQNDVINCHQTFEADVVEVEDSVDAMQKRFQALDRHMSGASQIAIPIGGRLQAAEVDKQRAISASHTLRHLKRFSITKDFSDLDEAFRDPAAIEATAELTRRMLALAQQLTAARTKTRPQAATQPPIAGSIEYAAAKLGEFRQSVEMKVVSKFDTASSEHDIATVRQCVSIMAHFVRGSDTLVHRYIASRPMFMDARTAMGQGATMKQTGTDSKSALQHLTGLLKAIEGAVTREAASISQIFPPSASALPAFVTRLFEQHLKTELDTLLVVPPAEAPPEALQAYLNLLAQSYRLTRDLASKLQPVMGPECDASALADVVFSEALREHLDLELAWLQQLFQTRAATAAAHGRPLVLSLELVAELLFWNREAVQRTAILCADGESPSSVRALFHNSTPDCASAGCLLEQVATHTIGALAAASDEGRLAAAVAFQPPPHLRNAAMLNKAVTPVVAQTIGNVLATVSAAASASELLQRHYKTVIVPAVESDTVEAATCAAGLEAMTKAVEGRATATLCDAFSDLAKQVDMTLVAEQKKSDFLVKDSVKPTLDMEKMTQAALLATAMLRAASRIAALHLHSANLASFLTQLGKAVHRVLLAHMQRFIFSTTGALRWKRDLSEYTDWARALRVPLLTEAFQELQEVANLLVVAPNALLSLVDGDLRMRHSVALNYLRLREDFKSARISLSNMALAQQFAGD